MASASMSASAAISCDSSSASSSATAEFCGRPRVWTNATTVTKATDTIPVRIMITPFESCSDRPERLGARGEPHCYGRKLREKQVTRDRPNGADSGKVGESGGEGASHRRRVLDVLARHP